MKPTKIFDGYNFMQAALEEALSAKEVDEVPVGAVIVEVNSGKIIAACHNLTISKSDPTAHAEILAIREAAKKLGVQRLDNCDIYVTLEPCPMCAQAISFARIRRLYYGAADEKGGGVDHGACVFSASSCHYKPEIYSGIMESECSELLRSFFKEKR